MDTRAIGVASIHLGAGRHTKEDSINPAVGFMMGVRLGDWVNDGDPLLFVHHDGVGLEAARAELSSAFTIGDVRVAPPPLIIERLEA